MVTLLGLAAFSGAAAAHDDGDGLTAHNQTQPLDQHDEVHTITIDKATADTDFYVDVHANGSTINETATFEAGTTLEDLELDLNSAIESDTEVTVAVHAADETELAASTALVNVTDSTGAEQTETTTTEGSGDGHETDTGTHEATTTEESSGSGPGFGVIAAVVASIGAALIGRRFGGSGEA